MSEHEHNRLRDELAQVVKENDRVKRLLNMFGVPDERMRGHISTGLDVFATRMAKEVHALQSELAALKALCANTEESLATMHTQYKEASIELAALRE